MNFKRIFDLTISILASILLFPVLIVIAASVYFYMGKPVLFKHIRPGLNGKPFRMYKFRTMRQTTADTPAKHNHTSRITPFGRFLRSTSLDELPELFNVIKGEMSLVGPRPLLMEYLELYNDEQRRRHDVKPGITGWAQVNGRNAISWQDKFALDVWYVDNHNGLLDIKILFATVINVLFRKDITPNANSDEMEPFKGNSNL